MPFLGLIALPALACGPYAGLSQGPNVSPCCSPGIAVGWHDEMDNRVRWKPLATDNKAFVAVPTPDVIFLGLDTVPQNWPYTYQWSGVQQDARVDIARFPVVSAYLTQVQGYAYLDIDVLDSGGKVSQTVRTPTLTSPGVATLDLGKDLSPAVYSFRIRLIVGGPNSGCCATYKWVRFTTTREADYLSRHPAYKVVDRPIGMSR